MISRYFDLLAEEKKYRLSEQSTLLSSLLSNPSRGKLSILRRAGLALTGLQVNGKITGGSSGSGRIIIEFANPISSNSEESCGGGGFKAGEMVKIIVNGKLLNCIGTVERRKRQQQQGNQGKQGNLKEISVSLSTKTEAEELEILMSSSNPKIALIKIVDEVGMFERMRDNLKGFEGENGGDLVVQLREFINHSTQEAKNTQYSSVCAKNINQESVICVERSPLTYRLNKEQVIAVESSLKMISNGDGNNFMTIHGPPGTGKTSVLVEIIERILMEKNNLRILICGPSNLSVDNIIERILKGHSIGKTSKLLRIGHPSRVLESCQRNTLDFWSENCDEGKLLRDVQGEIENLERNQLGKCKNWSEKREIYGELRLLRQERRRREKVLQGNLISKARIVACTLSTAGGKKLKGQHFDLAVVDEAGQSLLPEMLIAPLLASKLILVGDHFQLPPTVMNPEIKKSLEVSLFEKLIKSESKTENLNVMLKEQYRMNHLIMKWSNAKFYGNQLRANEGVKDWSLQGNRIQGSELLDVLIFYDTCGFDLWESVEGDGKDSKGKLMEEMSKFNEGEAKIVINHYNHLMKAGIDPSQIAIISPYSAQVTLIRELLDDSNDLEVNSIDAFQGREKDVVILSLVRSNGDGTVGFLGEMRRINVAMTRAKKQLVIIGDSDTLSRDDELKDLVRR